MQSWPCQRGPRRSATIRWADEDGLTQRGHRETARDVMPGTVGDIAGIAMRGGKRGQHGARLLRGRGMVAGRVLLGVCGTGVIRCGHGRLLVGVGVARGSGRLVGRAGVAVAGGLAGGRVVAVRGVVVVVVGVHGEQKRHETEAGEEWRRRRGTRGSLYARRRRRRMQREGKLSSRMPDGSRSTMNHGRRGRISVEGREGRRDA